MLALRAHLRQQNWFTERQLPIPNLADLLDIVALGTVADVVPLDENNRILVHQGILRIRSDKCRPGTGGCANSRHRYQVICGIRAKDLSWPRSGIGTNAVLCTQAAYYVAPWT